jgi:two-component system response regulator GlrR
MPPPKSILVVDDDANVRTLLRRAIEHMGHQVVEASDAPSAIALLERQKVDLVLCDVRMPGLDGVWLLDQIVTRFPDIPVALATGMTEMDPRVTLRRGVVGYLTKPFRLEPLRLLIEKVDEKQASGQRWSDGDVVRDEELDRLLEPADKPEGTED